MKNLGANIRFFITDAWDELKHSPGVNLLAVGTLVAVLFATGLLSLIWTNLDGWVQGLRSEVRVDLYLRDDIDSTTLTTLQEDLQRVDGAERVVYVTKEEALERYRQWSGNTAQLFEDLEENPLPASFEVFLVSGPAADEAGASIVAGFSERPGVEQVRFDREWLGRIDSVLDLAQPIGQLR